MIKKVSAFLMMIICFLPGVNAFASLPAEYKSKEIYDFSRQIEEFAKNQIWNEFDFRNYTRLKNDSESGYLYFSTEPDNQNDRTFSWRLLDSYFQSHSLEDDLVITFHEAFHAFESDPKRKGVKWGAENSLVLFEYQETSARSSALFSTESRVLRAALQSKNISELRKKARQFLAIRKLRQGELDPRFVEFEKGAELNEGLAEYAGTKAVLAGIRTAGRKQTSIPFTKGEGNEYLKEKYEILNTITGVGKNIRRKFYYTGSAQGFLLDRLMPGWKLKIQIEGKKLQDLLETAVGKLPAGKAVETILSQNGYENILIEEEKSAAQRKIDNRELLEKTLNQKGRKYIIDYSALSKPGAIRNFDPMNVTLITPKVRVHTRSVNFAGGDNFKAGFSQPVVEDLENKRYTTIVPENESQIISLDGEILDSTKFLEKRFAESLVITSPNFTLEAVSGTIRITGESIVINLSEK